MSLRVKIGLVLTGLLAAAIIVNAIYQRLTPKNDGSPPQNQGAVSPPRSRPGFTS